MSNDLSHEEYWKLVNDDFKASIQRGIDKATAAGVERGLPEDIARKLAEFLACRELNAMAYANWIGPKNAPLA